MKTAVIIGAGVGGLAAATYLARGGYKVTIFEKNAFPGGRCASFSKDGHRFDIGATLLMMPQVYERTFADFGKDLYEELDLVRMDPVYRLKYPGNTELLFSSDLMKMQQQLEAIEPGSYAPFLQYMNKSYRAYRLSMKHIIDRNYYHIFEFINFSNFIRLFQLKAFSNHYRLASRYFSSEPLRIAFTFQNIHVASFDHYSLQGIERLQGPGGKVDCMKSTHFWILLSSSALMLAWGLPAMILRTLSHSSFDAFFARMRWALWQPVHFSINVVISFSYCFMNCFSSFV